MRVLLASRPSHEWEKDQGGAQQTSLLAFCHTLGGSTCCSVHTAWRIGGLAQLSTCGFCRGRGCCALGVHTAFWALSHPWEFSSPSLLCLTPCPHQTIHKVSGPCGAYIGMNCWHRQSRLPAILLFLFFWHSHMRGWIADTQQVNSLSCPFACATFVGRRNVSTGLVPKGLLSLGGILGGGKSQPIPGKPTVTAVCSADTLPRSPILYLQLGSIFQRS